MVSRRRLGHEACLSAFMDGPSLRGCARAASRWEGAKPRLPGACRAPGRRGGGSANIWRAGMQKSPYGISLFEVFLMRARVHEPRVQSSRRSRVVPCHACNGRDQTAAGPVEPRRSEERRVGKEWVSQCSSRRWPTQTKQNKNKNKKNREE